jgi:hypothetical protein
MSKSNTAAQSTSPKVSDEYRLGSVAPTAATQSVPAPDNDHIPTLLQELGNAEALVDLLFMVASDSDVESLHEHTLSSSMHILGERLATVRVAAEAILDEMSAAARGAPPTDKAISTYATAAAEYGLPVWAMMVPGTTKDMFEDRTKIRRVVQMMQDYLASSDAQRGDVETVASDCAEINRGRATEVAHG